MRLIWFRVFGLMVVGMMLGGSLMHVSAQEQNNRIRFNGQDLFLSGGNVAWINFARDIGPGATNFQAFDDVFAEVHASGGNSMRLWLHTTGAVTPEWDGPNVIGPGQGAIEDLEAILDLAWKHEVGLILTLWSFDMLRIENGTQITDRAYGILTDSSLTATYIDNALIPMVEALQDHPGIIAWEIFNEAEGMSNEHGWNFNRHVPMRDIQAFVNRTAGAIHRTDPDAQVTTGAWAFIAQSDKLGDTRNYYRDDRLIEAGGDSLGILDFYTVHYYDWAGTRLSPFHTDYAYWELDKPLVVAEFFVPDNTFGVAWEDLYTTLYDRGYAGALAWQWFDWYTNRPGLTENWPRALENMQTLWNEHRQAVDVVFEGIRVNYFEADPEEIEEGGSSTLRWEVSGAVSVTIDGAAVDSAGTRTVTPAVTTTYTLVATAAAGESETRELTVQVLTPEEINRARGRPVFTSSNETCCGNADPSKAVDGDLDTRWASDWEDDQWIYVDLGRVFDLHRVILEWETAYGRSYDIDVSNDGTNWSTVHEERSGNGGTDEVVFTEPVAGRYVRMHGLTRATQWGFSLWEFEVRGLPSAQQASRFESENAALTGETTVRTDLQGASEGKYVEMKNTGTITWTDVMAPAAGDYTLAIGYYLPFEPKWQFIRINGEEIGEFEFGGATERWLALEIPVTLKEGSNTVEIRKSWGWMHFDYIEIRQGTTTAAEDSDDLPEVFELGDNYPNPFNPETVIPYSLPQSARVRLEVFDLTGRRIAVLVDHTQPAGKYVMRFDGHDLASGVYLYRITAGSFVETKRMVLMK